MKPLPESSIAITGLARDCSKTLISTLDALDRAFSDAHSLDIIIIESDSTDDTVALLEQEATRRANLWYVSMGTLRLSHPKRTDRIAVCRNRYLTALRENPGHKNHDYIIVADLDGVNSLINRDSVRSCWTREDWDVCTANQKGPYYDVWALRHPSWSPNDCWEQVRFLNSWGTSIFLATFTCVTSRMINIPSNADWIEVDSAFGGLAIYKSKLLAGVIYEGLTDLGNEVCEHVSVHSQIRNAGGRIYINPALVNSDLAKHVINASVPRIIIYWLRCKAKELIIALSPIFGFDPYRFKQQHLK